MERQLFLSDDEFEARFGPQLAASKVVLDRCAEKVCIACGGECCKRIGCAFYSPRFDSCPIREYRPAKCRLYYCERILDSDLVEEQEQRLLKEAARNVSQILWHSHGLDILLMPPVRIGEKDWLDTIGLDDTVNGIVRAFENNELDISLAKARLTNTVQWYRRAQLSR